MGTVYKAWDQRLGRTVAVKAMRECGQDEVTRRRFVREAKLACQVIHPYVAMVLDVVDLQGDLFLVMEHIEGRRFDEMLQREQPSPRELARFMLEIAEALESIHDAGLIHRDLKPGNIMIMPNGHVKVLDFGVARRFTDDSTPTHVSDAPTDATLTVEGAAVGTMLYMSPEQLRGQKVDRRSDLFALGVILYEAITSEHPFSRPTTPAIISAILSEPPSAGSVPNSLTDSGPLRHVVLRLIDKAPEQRYQDAGTLVEDLKLLIEGKPLIHVGRHVDPRRRFVLGAVLVTTVVLVLAAIGLWRWQPRSPPGEATGPNARPLVAVLPFVDHTGEADGPLRGQMLADLLGADIGESGRLRALDSERVQEIAAGDADASVAGRVARIEAAAPVAWILAGDLYRDGDSYQAAVGVYRAGNSDPQGSFRVAAAGTATLADLAKVKLNELLYPDDPEREDNDPESARLTSASEEARLLEFEARRALREMRYADAIDLLEQALVIDPRFLKARIQLALTLDQAGYGARARETANEALRAVAEPAGSIPNRLGLEARAVHARVHDNQTEELAFRRELAGRYTDEPAIQRSLAAALEVIDADSDEALATIDRALDLDRLDPRSFVTRATILAKTDRFDEATQALDRAESLYRNMGSGAGLLFVALRRGFLDARRGRYEDAAVLSETAAAGFRDLELTGFAVVAEKNLADMHLYRGNLSVAAALYQDLLARARTAGQYRMIVNILDTLGGTLYRAGRIEEGENQFKEALRQARRLDNPRLLTGPMLNLAGVLNYQGKVHEGRDLAQEGLALARKRNDQTAVAHAQNLLADADFQLGHLSRAVETYREIIRYLRSPSGSTAKLGFSLASIAPALRHLGATEEALEAIEEAIGLSRQQDKRIDLGYQLITRSLILAELAQGDQSLRDLDEAGIIANDKNEPLLDLQPRVELTRARVLLMRGDQNEAEEILARLREVDADSKAVGVTMQLWIASCESSLVADEAESGMRYCRLALEYPNATIVGRVRARLGLARAQSLEGQIDSAETEARTALDAAEKMGLSLTTAKAAAVLVSLPGQRADHEALLGRGRKALVLYMSRAPSDRRVAMMSRADLKETAILLGLSQTGGQAMSSGRRPQSEEPS
jgi:tetratricopeptide (TPR) repeat protein